MLGGCSFGDEVDLLADNVAVGGGTGPSELPYVVDSNLGFFRSFYQGVTAGTVNGVSSTEETQQLRDVFIAKKV